MISLYSGTPGSGKSLHTAQLIYDWLVWAQKPVIANFPINMDMVQYTPKQARKMRKNQGYKPPKKRTHGRFYYFSDDVLTPELLVRYAKKFHKPRKENQTLLVIDECSSDALFSNRSWQNKNRQKWIRFFQQHRKLGFTVILVAQSDKLIDKAIRCFIEYETKHRKLNNFKAVGKIAGFLAGGSLFIAVQTWYCIREKTGQQIFRYKRMYGDFYDSYFEFK